MADRVKVLSWLEGLTFDDWRMYHSDTEVQNIAKEALELIKEQEEETTFVYDEYTTPMCKKCGFHPFAGYIPTIKWMKERGYMKCPYCGRAVKWE